MQLRQRLTLQLSLGLKALSIHIATTLMALLAALFMPGTSVLAVSAEVPTVPVQKLTDPGAPWGIRVIGIRRTAADYMLDFRYRVLDVDKAAYLMNRKIKPQLIVEKTGHKLQVPVSSKIGPLRQSPKYTKADRNYFMFFANPGRAVQAGDKVTVVIGDFKAEHLVVE